MASIEVNTLGAVWDGSIFGDYRDRWRFVGRCSVRDRMFTIALRLTRHKAF